MALAIEGSHNSLPSAIMQQVRAKDGMADEVKQKELLGNKLKENTYIRTHTHNLFLMYKASWLRGHWVWTSVGMRLR